MTFLRFPYVGRYGFRIESLRFPYVVPPPSLRFPYRYGASPSTVSVYLYRFTNAFLKKECSGDQRY